VRMHRQQQAPTSPLLFSCMTLQATSTAAYDVLQGTSHCRSSLSAVYTVSLCTPWVVGSLAQSLDLHHRRTLSLLLAMV
jgi:hypothetical protein